MSGFVEVSPTNAVVTCPASVVEYDCDRFETVWNAPSLARPGNSPQLLYVFLPGTGSKAARFLDGLLQAVAEVDSLSVIALSYGSSPWYVHACKQHDLYMMYDACGN